MAKRRLSISLPEGLAKEFDEVVKKTKQPTRSHAIESAMREYIISNKWMSGKGKTAGAILLTYNHDTRGINEDLVDIQHAYESIISASLHIHLDKHQCLEIIAVRGEIKEIKELVRDLHNKKGILSLKVVTAA